MPLLVWIIEWLVSLEFLTPITRLKTDEIDIELNELAYLMIHLKPYLLEYVFVQLHHVAPTYAVLIPYVFDKVRLEYRPRRRRGKYAPATNGLLSTSKMYSDFSLYNMPITGNSEVKLDTYTTWGGGDLHFKELTYPRRGETILPRLIPQLLL